MNAAELLKHFDRIAEAPDAVERLRRFILDLAVRGKLIKQVPTDEPASILRRRIAIARGIDANAIQADAAAAFSIPTTWEWVQATFPAQMISDLGKKIPLTEVLKNGTFPVIDQGKIFIRGFCNEAEKVIRVDQPVILFGDHTRETKFIDFDFVVGADGVKLLKPIGIAARYYFLALQWLPLDSRGYGRHFKLLKAAAFPLPPLAEQHRIVAKVDELMALCDQLQAAHTARELQRDALVAASLHRLTAAEATPDQPTRPFTDAARFHLTHLPRLTTRPEHIQQLRQTILNLAVRGRLVEQDARDQSSTALLLKIDEIGGRKAKPAMPTAPFEVPKGWSWSTVGALTSKTGSGSTPRGGREVYKTSGIPFLRSQNVYDEGLRLGDVAFIDEVTHRRMAGTAVEPGDLLLNITGGSIGRCCRLPDDQIKANISQHVAIIRMAFPELRDYSHIVVLSPFFQSFVIGEQTGAGRGGLPKNRMDQIPFPLPPLAEQRRIVAKVDELMQLCDALQAELVAGQTQRSRLLEALLHRALNPGHENVLDMEQARKKRQADREAIACYAVRRLAKHKSFGRTMQAKVLYMAEAHCGQSLGGAWRRQARGPYDGWIGDFEVQAKQANWFLANETTLTSGKPKIVYTPGKAIDAKADEALAALGPEASEFDRVLTLFSEKTTEEVEIIATLFAAWNDLLLDGKASSDDDIVREVREHWHPDKARFTPEVLKGWLEWMRKHQLTPAGRPPHTSYQADLL